MKTSARNLIEGKIMKVETDKIMVRARAGQGHDQVDVRDASERVELLLDFSSTKIDVLTVESNIRWQYAEVSAR
jgi:hypothetical protein